MNSSADIEALQQKIYLESAFVDRLREHTSQVIVGQRNLIDRLLIGLLTNGHVLLEGMPGLAKTTAIKALSTAIEARFSRIQFTPDLLPSDVLGTMIYHPGSNSFQVRKGPIFAHLVLADEINRAPAKVQSALLEAMQERQVTIGTESFHLEEPFLVLATQNPIEQEGTYPLPEAQVDRFLLKVKVGYPEKDEEREIIRRQLYGVANPTTAAVADIPTILRARKAVAEVYLDEKIERYIIDLVFATRQPDQYRLPRLKPLLSFGGSPRASIGLALAARAHAFLQRRGYVVPDDVRTIAPDVLRHRMGLTYEAEAEGITADEIVHQILNTVEVP